MGGGKPNPSVLGGKIAALKDQKNRHKMAIQVISPP